MRNWKNWIPNHSFIYNINNIYLYYIMSLQKIVDNLYADKSIYTDKNTIHSYLELYQELLINKKNTAKFVLEIGIGDFGEKNGGSIKMWREFFTNATIIALDILPIERVIDDLINDDRVILYTETDAYNAQFFIENFLIKNIRCYFMLDDGPHTL